MLILDCTLRFVQLVLLFDNSRKKTDSQVSRQARDASYVNRRSHKTARHPVAWGQRRETRRRAMCVRMRLESAVDAPFCEPLLTRKLLSSKSEKQTAHSECTSKRHPRMIFAPGLRLRFERSQTGMSEVLLPIRLNRSVA